MTAPTKCPYCNSQAIEQHTCGCAVYKCGTRFNACGPDPGPAAENCIRLQLLAALKRLRLKDTIIRSMRPDRRETFYPGSIRVTDDGPIGKRQDVDDQFVWPDSECGQWYEVTHVCLVEQVTVKEIDAPPE